MPKSAAVCVVAFFVAAFCALYGQQAIPVGAGSYAEFPPKHEDFVDGVDVGMVSNFLNRTLYIHPSKAGGSCADE